LGAKTVGRYEVVLNLMIGGGGEEKEEEEAKEEKRNK
jgi:hypothetical protein